MNDDEDSPDIRERLADYLTHVESYPLGPVNGKLAICAESMADALLPFIRAELAEELLWLACTLECYADIDILKARASELKPRTRGASRR